MEQTKKSRRCCFTGHRPEKLNISEEEVKSRLNNAIEQAIADGFTTFISGMARGVDMWAAEIVLQKREKNKDIKLICASPYISFEKPWSDTEKDKYNSIMKKADFIKFVSHEYFPSCFQVRNRYMVDNSARVIAVYGGESGGTKNTIKYATKRNVEIINALDEKIF